MLSLAVFSAGCSTEHTKRFVGKSYLEVHATLGIEVVLVVLMKRFFLRSPGAVQAASLATPTRAWSSLCKARQRTCARSGKGVNAVVDRL